MDLDNAGIEFGHWLDEHTRIGDTDTPSRVIVVLAALERIRHTPTLDVKAHVTSSGQQLIAHDRFVRNALQNYRIDTPVTAGGRRASNLGAWINPLFEFLRAHEFDREGITESARAQLIDALGTIAARRVATMNLAEPLVARFSKGTARAVVVDLLDQAQAKKRAKDVAEYLIGAKLESLYGPEAIKRKDINTPSEFGDFQVGDTAIEVTVNPPDDRHIEGARRILEKSSLAFWLFVRLGNCERWQNKIQKTLPSSAIGRVVVSSVEDYVCHNVTERGHFTTVATKQALMQLFEIYNERWLPRAGGEGIRIVSGNPDSSPRD